MLTAATPPQEDRGHARKGESARGFTNRVIYYVGPVDRCETKCRPAGRPLRRAWTMFTEMMLGKTACRMIGKGEAVGGNRGFAGTGCFAHRRRRRGFLVAKAIRSSRVLARRSHGGHLRIRVKEHAVTAPSTRGANRCTRAARDGRSASASSDSVALA